MFPAAHLSVQLSVVLFCVAAGWLAGCYLHLFRRPLIASAYRTQLQSFFLWRRRQWVFCECSLARSFYTKRYIERDVIKLQVSLCTRISHILFHVRASTSERTIIIRWMVSKRKIVRAPLPRVFFLLCWKKIFQIKPSLLVYMCIVFILYFIVVILYYYYYYILVSARIFFLRRLLKRNTFYCELG